MLVHVDNEASINQTALELSTRSHVPEEEEEEEEEESDSWRGRKRQGWLYKLNFKVSGTFTLQRNLAMGPKASFKRKQEL